LVSHVGRIFTGAVQLPEVRWLSQLTPFLKWRLSPLN
jgi:hypothetical protein